MIKRLKIHQLRILSDIDLSLSRCNVFIGNNGSGKTSVLEAVYLLSRGKSFRHFESKRYIHHNADACTVWADMGMHSFAIAKYKDDSKTQLRQNQSPLPNQSLLARALPVLLIDPAGMVVLEEGTASRRQLLDFLCFHSEPEFHSIWLDYQRALKQRNNLLKIPNIIDNHKRHQEIYAWDTLLSQSAEALTAIRRTVFEAWQSNFEKTVSLLLPQYSTRLSLGFVAGFDDSHSLKALLQERLNQDIELGYTRIGAHRADISISLSTPLDDKKSHKEQAIHVMSRGEKKLLITALKLAGLPLICQTPHLPIVLIDDIDSELDNTARQLFLRALLALDCQIFISSLCDTITTELENLGIKPSVFLLNQGKLSNEDGLAG